MTYATEQELIDYAAARGITLQQDPAVLLTLSQDYLDAQRLNVPAPDADPDPNADPDPDPVPDDLVRANIVGAVLIDQGNDLLAPIGQRVLSESVDGAVSVSYSDQGRSTTAYPQLEALIAPYRVAPVGFMQIGVER